MGNDQKKSIHSETFLWLSAVAFIQCLKVLPPDFKASNILAIMDMLPSLFTHFSELREVFGENTEFISYIGDIKENYTHLPQKIIIESIKVILAKFRKTQEVRKSQPSQNIPKTAGWGNHTTDLSYAVRFICFFEICLYI
jgi:hypothetical protein